MADFRGFNVGIVPICAKIFKASASRTRGHSHLIIWGSREILSLVKPGPQAIVVNELISIFSGNCKLAIAPVSVSGQPIINASGKWETNNIFRDSGTAIDNIPTPEARAPKPVKIAPPA